MLVSLLVMLNLPVILTGTTGMDQYGFFTLDPVAARPWPLALSLALGTFSAVAGYLVCRLLQRRAWFVGNRYEAYHRNAIVFGVPVAVAFLPMFFLTGYANKPLVLGVAGIMATSLCLIAALNDREISIDDAIARLLFLVCAAIILLLVALSVSGMLAMYFVEHSPCSGNFFWSWEFAWSDLGYPAEEFNRRHRYGLLAFGIAGTLYMTVALGGSLLGGILRWTKDNSQAEAGHPPPDPAQQQEEAQEFLDTVQAHPEETPAFLSAVNGEEVAISRSRYEELLANKDILPRSARLLVDKASGTAFAKVGGNWKRISFRGRRKGPFLLLCVYARRPGRRFTTGELESLLAADLPEREGFNVSDIVTQLQKRKLPVPVRRDADGTYIPKTVGVCFLDHYQSAPQSADETDSFPEAPLVPPNGTEQPAPPPPQS